MTKHIQIDDRLFLDLEREKRTLIPEVVYAPNKADRDLLEAIEVFIKHKNFVFVSRLSEYQIELLRKHDLKLNIDEVSRTASFGEVDLGLKGTVALISAGTSDLKVANESKAFLKFSGVETKLFSDIGVASIGRLFHSLPEIEKTNVLIIFAGMEGALPSVIAGLVNKPIIAVPTSTGYGVSAGGNVALNAMLSSCSPGITVCNIDNGIGAAAAAVRILGINKF